MLHSRITAILEKKYILFYVITVPAVAVLMLGVHFLASGMYIETERLWILLSMYVLISASVTCAVFLFIMRKNITKDEAVETNMRIIGYNDTFFSYCLKKCEKIRSDRKRAMAKICVCQYYADAKEYDKAIELLKSISLVPLKAKERAAYYCVMSYVLFLSGDEEGAFAALSADPPLLGKVLRKKHKYRNIRLGIMYVNAIQCTDTTPPSELVAEIDAIKNKTTEPVLVCEACIMLSLLSLKNAELAKAKEYISEARLYCAMFGQNKRIEALMEIIEECYGVKSRSVKDSKQES